MRNYEDQEDRCATPSEACREYAHSVGADHPERPWILTDYDTWEKDPYYTGPAVPHPDDCFGAEPGPQPADILDGKPSPYETQPTDDEIPF